MNFSFKNRPHIVKKLKEETYDLVIIGGGISGAGVARDAASRGMKVALVEANDFASGTSSRSSKLIHGGIRYLENYEFDLVFEALSERGKLFDFAPHLVHPLRFMLPVYKDSRVGMFLLGMGMWLYDALSMFQAPKMHERLNATKTLQRSPNLNPKDLVGSYVYSDAYMDDDRLVIETLRSAHSMGAQCISYAKCTGVKKDGNKLTAIEVTDLGSGETFSIKGKSFVATVGPWTDILGEMAMPNWKKKMRPSKGVHLTIPRNRMKLDEAVVMVSNDQKRIVFGIPRKDMIIIGTTDTDFKDNPSKVKTDAEDVKYLLEVANQYFPGANLKVSDIMASYSGIRPLVDDGSESESKTSREHEIFDVLDNFCFLTGGKYTTYRSMAEETIEHILEKMPVDEGRKFAHSKTTEALNPMADLGHLERAHRLLPSIQKSYSLDPEVVKTLVERHGMEALDLIKEHRWHIKNKESLLWILEAHHAIDNEMCFHLIDFYLRRTPLFLTNRDNGLSHLEEVSRVFAEKLGWSIPEVKEEQAKIHEHIAHEMGWKKEMRS